MPKPSLRTLSRLSRQALCAGGAIALLTLASTAEARAPSLPDGMELVARIKLTDLDLTTDRGVDKLHRRLSLKARRYCRNTLPVSSPTAVITRCEERVVAENMSKLHQAIDEAEAARALR